MIAGLVSGCASTQLNNNTVELSSSVDDIYTKQTLNNISKFIDDPNAIPSQMVLSAGVFQTGTTITPSVNFPFTDAATRTLTAAATLSSANARATAGAGAILSGTNSQQQNYTVAPVSDAVILRNQQALYQHAVYGKALLGRYIPQRVFIKDTFYLDPFHLQLPQCVICSKQQGVFTKEIAVYGATPNSLRPNPELSSGWVYLQGGINASTGEKTVEELIDLGQYGNHNLFIKRSDYNNGVLNKLVISTLNFSQPVENFSTGAPQFIINNIPNSNADGPVSKQGNSPGSTKPSDSSQKGTTRQQRILVAPGSNAPATNLQVTPQSPFNLIVPQTIIPSQ
uniref:hypothetical protein n=1 Tax=Methylobacterium sp. TaxID=409 RepID=UPI0020C8A6C8|nr:hypothetical protein [Methylobacterium sp.]USU34562.1 hypothetical protein NG677_23555 [Methylobacterium sp.]